MTNVKPKSHDAMMTLSAQLEGIQSRADRSWKLTFGTNELTPEEIGRLGAMQNAVCHLGINPNPFTSDELDTIRNTKAELMETGKTHSQRLRGVLYANWQNDPQGYENFHDYYMVKMDKVIEDLESALKLYSFMHENKKSGGLSKKQSDEIKVLWDKYKLLRVKPGTSIIDADFGMLGSLVIREVESTTFDKHLKYQGGSYDYVMIVTNKTKRILWTDYSEIEPYNRHGGLYCGGSSFASLGAPIVQTPTYRTFVRTDLYKSDICFGVWGFYYNEFYGSVRFGICLDTNLVDEFIKALTLIIKK